MLRFARATFLRALLLGLAVYAGFGFIHVEWIIYACGECQFMPLSAIWPLVVMPTDLFGILSFVVSFASFVAWRYLCAREKA